MPTPTDSPVIEVSDLVRKFGDRVVINDISFNVRRGETLVIMGGSGCGKSTLLRHIIGSMKPTSGSVKIFGQEITTMNEREIASVPDSGCYFSRARCSLLSRSAKMSRSHFYSTPTTQLMRLKKSWRKDFKWSA